MDEKPSPGIFDLMTMGVSSAAMVGVATAIGFAIDDWLHSSPAATLAGLAFGLVAGVANMVVHIRRYL
ncbi:MAG TPA: AtpZ/AtpI family protein [Acidimicrobiales bacterium]|nr:AtpZ/AtpI family protein [Acidimicrobiales bacterium]